MSESLSAAATSELRRLETLIITTEGDGLRARWQFGQEVLKHRADGALKKMGGLAALAELLKVHRSELHARVKFAQKFPTETELSDAIRQFPTWHAITHNALPDKKQTAAPRLASTPVKRLVALLDDFNADGLTKEQVTLIVAKLRDTIERVNNNPVLKAAA